MIKRGVLLGRGTDGGANEGRAMASELHWEGFAWSADAVIREALDAADMDSSLSGRPRCEDGGVACFEAGFFDDDAQDPPCR